MRETNRDSPSYSLYLVPFIFFVFLGYVMTLVVVVVMATIGNLYYT